MKQVIVSFVAIALASVAQASYLNWQINGTEAEETGGNQLSGIVGDSWNSAVFYQVSGDTKTALKIENGDGTQSDSMRNWEGGKYGAGPVIVNLGDVIKSSDDLASYSYYIELLNSNNELVGYKQGAYTELAGSVSYSDTLSPVEMASLTSWHGSGSYNAPEPTSAVLMMLGVAGLALRRKQRKQA